MISLTTLENGLRIVSYPMDQAETISMGVWIQAGSRCEHKQQSGIAHFLEHMAFKGTKTRSAFDIVKAIEGVGGEFNASTSQEITCYHISLLKEDTRLGIEILADILQNSVFLENEIEKEKNVVLQEIDQVQDQVDELLFDHFQEMAFSGQALGRPILGSRSHVQSFERTTLEHFVSTHYAPQNMVFSAAGHLDHQDLVRFVQKSFSLSKREMPPFDAAHYVGGVLHIPKPLEQHHMALGFEGVSLDSPDFYVAQCYASLLGGGMSSRLFQELREHRGLVYNVSSFSHSYHETGIFGLYTSSSATSMKTITQVMMDEIQKTTQDISEEECARAKTQIKAQLLMAEESTLYRASLLAKQVLRKGLAQETKEIIQIINAVTYENLRKFGARLLASSPTTVTIGSDI